MKEMHRNLVNEKDDENQWVKGWDQDRGGAKLRYHNSQDTFENYI